MSRDRNPREIDPRGREFEASVCDIVAQYEPLREFVNPTTYIADIGSLMESDLERIAFCTDDVPGVYDPRKVAERDGYCKGLQKLAGLMEHAYTYCQRTLSNGDRLEINRIKVTALRALTPLEAGYEIIPPMVVETKVALECAWPEN